VIVVQGDRNHNRNEVLLRIGAWGGTLQYFPPDPAARYGIADEIVSMAADIGQVEWLVSRAPKLYRDWPGMLEIRAVFCSKFSPADHFDAYSDVYLDGIPSEKGNDDARWLPAPDTKRLPEGVEQPVSAAESVRNTVADLVVLKDLNRVVIRSLPPPGKSASPPKVRDLPVVQITDKNRITQADIDKAVEEHRAAKTREETKAAAEAAGTEPPTE